MERKEKTEFILEQMRLLVAVARTKDQEGKELKAKGTLGKKDGAESKVAVLDGDTEWLKVRVGGRRVPEAFLAEPGNEVGLSSFEVLEHLLPQTVVGRERWR
jgi:26S proteasome regulatory subunit N5